MRRLSLTLIVFLALTGCASVGDDPLSDGEPPTPSDEPRVDAVLVVDHESIATGPGISVTEALGYAGDEPVLVNGSLFIDARGVPLLCEAIAESFPPQCGGRRLLVEGLDPAAVPDLQEANGVRWAESVQLLGRVEPAS